MSNQEIYKQTALNRAFELEVIRAYNNGHIKSPIYLGIGQEHIAPCIHKLCPDYAVFIQHRCHAYGLSYGISPTALAKEILGKSDGLNNGMGGSASFGDKSKLIFGHSGLLGDQVPIACGYALKHKTVCVLGDAAAEEDYVLGSLGFAATHNLPILFVCEDNNLSILTEKSVRRSWSIVDVAKGFGINAINIDDNPFNILSLSIKLPMLVNINTERHMWHCGTGQDNKPSKDILQMYIDMFGSRIYNEAQNKMRKIWDSVLSEK